MCACFGRIPNRSDSEKEAKKSNLLSCIVNKIRNSLYKGPDKISDSPSLPFIISYLDNPNDVISCRFVNKRWNRVVQYNYRSMARFDIEIIFSKSMDEENGKECLEIILLDNSLSTEVLHERQLILISDRRIRFSKNLTAMYEYYLTNGTSIKDKEKLPSDVELLQKVHSRNSSFLKRSVDFDVHSQLDGLDQLLAFLSTTFYFSYVDFRHLSNPSPAYLSRILQVLQQNPTNCREMWLLEYWPQLEEIHRALARPLVYVDPGPELNNVLPFVSKWTCPIYIPVIHNNIDDFSPLFDFLKRWQAGYMDILYLFFPMLSDGHGPWPMATVYTSLKKLGFWSLHYSWEDEFIEFTLRRRKDASTIRIYYCVTCKYIEVRDINYSDDPPSLLVRHRFHGVPLRKKPAPSMFTVK